MGFSSVLGWRKRVKFWRWALVAIGLWLAGVAVAIFVSSESADPAKSDVIVVLGAAVVGARPSPVLEGRLEEALRLYQGGWASEILLTGGRSPEDSLSEAEAGRDFLVAAGIPSSRIHLETSSRTTVANLREASRIMGDHGYRSALVVSDPLHLFRARRIARGLDMDAAMIATTTSRYRSLATKAPFALRELFFVHVFWVLGK
ncbi:MAG: YdcF family protein [Fibrobacterota bacterium]|nr:YdcF family protein [Fibrobacterota bacterium]QQS06110.1 MAG: YdcF family protein [Fibrobacterota bacterium]